MSNKRLYLLMYPFLINIILSSPGYCQYWITFHVDKDITQSYYIPPLHIDKEKKILVVGEKQLFSKSGKIKFLKGYKKMFNKECGNDIHYMMGTLYLNVKEWQYSINNIKGYSKTDSQLFEHQFETHWYDIIPDSPNDIILKKLIKDYDIQR